MCLLLNIDTATETGSIALSDGKAIIGEMINEDQKDHAAWIHKAIQELMRNAGRTFQQLQAVAVTAGPGSYTGLRVGMTTAKGLCYVLKIPLVTESTLKVMARAALEQALKAEMESAAGAGVENEPDATNPLFCPMIDARRMEVFTAAYDANLNEVLKPQPMVLDEGSFADLLSRHQAIFFGSGSSKFKNMVQHTNASFIDVRYTARHLAYLAQMSFSANNFTDPAYAEPVYLKEFYTHTKK